MLRKVKVPVLIVDLQGFQYNSNEFIVKELAVICYNTEYQAHYLFKPPYPFYSLTQSEKHQYRWLEKKYHGGVKWSDGYVSLSELPLVLRRIRRDATNIHPHHVLPKDVIIVCKGMVKKKFLQSYINNNKIIDLDDTQYPLPSLKLSNGPRCLQHVNYNSNCALANVHFLQKCILDLGIVLQSNSNNNCNPVT